MQCLIKVAQGSLRGKECFTPKGKRYYSFEGIPYAKPPVGKLRFRDPQPPEIWTGVHDATKPGNKCTQMDSTNSIQGSEDCLYLNVYTPSLPEEKIQKLPVLFFVHGGRIILGHGDYYRPDYFIEHDVILVTINYRLHILGFLCLDIPEVPGNAALKDSIMALKWVKRNITLFNGDKDNVTAIGESAGAGIVTSYLTSKMADGLTNKMVAESGICIADLMMVQEDPIEKAMKIVSYLGVKLESTRSLYEFLINAPIEDLVFATMTAELSKLSHILHPYFMPVVEKKFEGVERFFEEYPLETIKKNEHKKIPFLFALNSHEEAPFLMANDKGQITYINDLQLFIPKYLSLKYNSPESLKFSNNLKALYFGGKEINDQTKKEYVNLVADANFYRDIVLFAELYSKNCDKMFLSHFSYYGNMNTRVMKKLGLRGASHGDMLQYQFYRKSKAEVADDDDRKIVDFLSEVWCNFAKNGKPTWKNQQFEWRPYNQKERICLNIDTELRLTEYPYWNRIKCWLDYMGEKSKL